MIAVVLAAGLGTRFGNRTELCPKGFIEVYGEPMIISSIEALLAAGIEKIIIGTGYKHEMYDSLKKSYPQLETCFSPKYAETNSMHTLYNARNVIGDNDFILLESDIVYEPKAITEVLECKQQNVMLASPIIKFQDQYYIEYDSSGKLVNCSTDENKLKPMGELVGIHKISNSFFSLMCEQYEKRIDQLHNTGYEFQILHIARNYSPMYVLQIDNLKWYEIDDENDLQYAEHNIKIK